jgi:hypothetical protein
LGKIKDCGAIPVKKGIKTKDHEKLTHTNIEHVIKLLEDKQPITKKAACEILNISYNTTRLGKIIDEYKENKAYEASRREKNRGKPAESHEINTVIELYLLGEPVSDISKRLYRSPQFVSAIIERIGVPIRPTGDDWHRKAQLPEQCLSDTFTIGQIIWSAKYHASAKILAVYDEAYYRTHPGMSPIDYEAVNGCPCYKIHVKERLEDVPGKFSNVQSGGFFASQLAYDLGSLEHLKQYGVELEKL